MVYHDKGTCIFSVTYRCTLVQYLYLPSLPLFISMSQAGLLFNNQTTAKPRARHGISRYHHIDYRYYIFPGYYGKEEEKKKKKKERKRGIDQKSKNREGRGYPVQVPIYRHTYGTYLPTQLAPTPTPNTAAGAT